MCMFSIVVPVYNVERYLQECLKSIQSQSYIDFEAILVDDGSTDQSGKLCEDFTKTDERFQCIHISNGGLANARNTGIEAAKGKYICFIDSDDFVDSNFLESFYQGTINGDADIIYEGIRYYPDGKDLKPTFPTGRMLSGIEMIEKSPKVSSDISIPFSVRYCFCRRYLQENKFRFNPQIKYAEDSPFNLKAFITAKKVVCVPDVTYNYRIRPNSITQIKYKPTMLQDLDYYYRVKKMAQENLVAGRYSYTLDMTTIHIYKWIPSLIENYKASPQGFRVKDAKQMLNAEFIQDGVSFFLDNKLACRKLQKLYFQGIKRKSLFAYFVWKYFDLNDFIF